MSILIGFLLVVHVLVSCLMVGAVLMQLPRSEGLGAAFGGGMTENMFGAQTTHVLAKATVWLGMAFFALTLLLAVAYSRNQPTGEEVERKVLEGAVEQGAVTPDAPAAPTTQTPDANASEVETFEAVLDAPQDAPTGLSLEAEAAMTLDGVQEAPAPTPEMTPIPSPAP